MIKNLILGAVMALSLAGCVVAPDGTVYPAPVVVAPDVGYSGYPVYGPDVVIGGPVICCGVGYRGGFGGRPGYGGRANFAPSRGGYRHR